MKFLTAALSCAGLLQYAAAQGAYLYTVDRKVMSSSTAMIDSEMASAIIARRRALTEERYLEITNEMLLQDIDAYGGHQAPLFADGKKTEAPGKLFIRITGVDLKINDLDAAMPDLWVQEPTKDLLTDFKAAPSRQQKDNVCEYIVPPSLNTPNAQGVEVVFSYPLEDVRYHSFRAKLRADCCPGEDMPRRLRDTKHSRHHDPSRLSTQQTVRGQVEAGISHPHPQALLRHRKRGVHPSIPPIEALRSVQKPS